MKDVRFLYRDEGTNGEWREREGRFRDVAQAIEWYGLGTDCDYMMVYVLDRDTGEYDYAWVTEAEELDGAVELASLPEADPEDPERVEDARWAATEAVEDLVDERALDHAFIARLRYLDPANADRPDEYRVVCADPEVLERYEDIGHESVAELVGSSCDTKNGVRVGEVIGRAIQLEAMGQEYELDDPTTGERSTHNVVRAVQLRQLDDAQLRQLLVLPHWLRLQPERAFGHVGFVDFDPAFIDRCRDAARAAADEALRSHDRDAVDLWTEPRRRGRGEGYLDKEHRVEDDGEWRPLTPCMGLGWPDEPSDEDER